MFAYKSQSSFACVCVVCVCVCVCVCVGGWVCVCVNKVQATPLDVFDARPLTFDV